MVWKRVLPLMILSLMAIIAPIAAQPASKPLSLPIDSQPGLSTWLFVQPYGNTTGAYVRGSDWYEAGQRLHFGLDFSMACGTPLIAMADGVVDYVDDLGFGSGPHNLLIRHDQFGIIALYGHLLETPQLTRGQAVTQGQVVGLSGDPDITCDSRPHLHLEIRAPNYFTAYNPVDYIDANWHALAAVGSLSGRSFMQDLDNARQWMSLDDQPDVNFGGRALNDYAAPYPDLRVSSPPANPPLLTATAPLETNGWTQRRLTLDGCCSGAWWSQTQADRLYVIDGTPAQRAGIFEWNTADGSLVNLVGQAPPPQLSADGTYAIERRGDQFAIRQLADNTESLVTTGDSFPSLSADNSQILWTTVDETIPQGENRPTNVWIASRDGNNARVLVSETGISAQWLDSTRLLISKRERIVTTLTVYDTVANTVFTLGSWERIRGMSIAPGGTRLIFYTAMNPDTTLNNLHAIETQVGAEAQILPWFGAWRWRDADTVFYLPLDATAPYHTLHAYTVPSGQDIVLTDPAVSPFVVANGDWSVSPEGDQIAFWNALDMTIWLLEPS